MKNQKWKNTADKFVIIRRISEFQENSGLMGVKYFLFNSMSPEAVAKSAYRGLMSGKTIIIPGLVNNLVYLVIKFLPRSIVASLMRKMYQKTELG